MFFCATTETGPEKEIHSSHTGNQSFDIQPICDLIIQPAVDLSMIMTENTPSLYFVCDTYFCLSLLQGHCASAVWVVMGVNQDKMNAYI